MKPTKDEIREKAITAISRLEDYCSSRKGETNPQVLEMVHRSQGQILGLRAMLDAINGNMMMLNVECAGSVIPH